MFWLLACAPKTAAIEAPPLPTTALIGELAVDGPIKQRISTFPADLVVFYAGEHQGSMETCGCPKRPRGSLARLDAYVDAARGDSPAILVNGGWWLEDPTGFEGETRADVLLADQWMARGLAEGGWDALNATPYDLAGLAAIEGAPTFPVVSANVTGPGVVPYVLVERSGLRIGITGITAPSPTLTDLARWAIADPGAAGPVLEELDERADVVVLLAYQAAESARILAKRHDIDVVVDTAAHRAFVEPERVGRTVWVQSHYQTMRVGELRLRLDRGTVTGGVDRKIDLDPDMPDDASLARLTRQARAEIDAVQRQIYGAQP